MSEPTAAPVLGPAAGPPEAGPPSRRRVAARSRVDFWFDLVLLISFTVAYSYEFTGIGIHEWLGIALGAALLLHLTLHWDWVLRTTRRLVSPRGHDKLIWLVNLGLLVAMVLCVASGILASRVALPWLGITPPQGPFWLRLHVLTAEVTLGLVPVHVALRWRWIVAVGRRVLQRRRRPAAADGHLGGGRRVAPAHRGAARPRAARLAAARGPARRGAGLKFLRQFGAVFLVVGIVTGLGLAWDHLGPRSLPGEHGLQFSGPPPGGELPRGVALAPGELPPGGRRPHLKAGTIEVLRGPNGQFIVVRGRAGPASLGLNSMFERVDWPFAERTVVIEGAIMVAVLLLSSGHRRWRLARRGRRLAASAGQPPA